MFFVFAIKMPSDMCWEATNFDLKIALRIAVDVT